MKRRIIGHGGVAVGAYLKRLRIAADMTTTEVAARLGTTETQIWRLEAWKSDVRSSLLFAYISAVHGSADDVALLMAKNDATVDDGERLAGLRLASRL